MSAGEPINVFNFGRHKRDFTYIDDVVDGVYRVLQRPPTGAAGWDSGNPDPSVSSAPYRIYNIGNNKPVELMRMITVLEDLIGKEARLNQTWTVAGYLAARRLLAEPQQLHILGFDGESKAAVCGVEN